jgi:hypothetical protein
MMLYLLHDMLQVRKELTPDTRRKVNTLIITDVHGRDIIDTFVRDSIMDAREFAWESQLRFYWDKGMVSASTPSAEKKSQPLHLHYIGRTAVVEAADM